MNEELVRALITYQLMSTTGCTREQAIQGVGYTEPHPLEYFLFVEATSDKFLDWILAAQKQVQRMQSNKV